MVYQYYVMEIQQYANGEYGDIRHFAYDEDADKARMKGESKYYEILAAAAVSDIPSHAAILFSSEGFPIMHQCYKKTIAPAPAPTPEPEPEPENV